VSESDGRGQGQHGLWRVAVTPHNRVSVRVLVVGVITGEVRRVRRGGGGDCPGGRWWHGEVAGVPPRL
jgi:hypothetical protein